MLRGSLSHLALTVKDPERSAAFYEPILSYLGYRRLQVPEAIQQEMRTPLLAWAGPPGWLTLRPPKPGREDLRHDRTAPGLNHFAFHAASREDVDGLYQVLQDIGAEILDPPADYDYMPEWYAVYFQDPDGIKFEFAHSTEIGPPRPK